MKVSRELNLALGSLAFLNLLLALGAIALFVRMAPAIEKILSENDYSIEAAEELLQVLAKGGAYSDSDIDTAKGALARARSNVTEEPETPVLDALDETIPAALDGKPEARRRSIELLAQLLDINRSVLRSADDEAKGLGRGGAWAAVLVGLLSFGLCLLILRRLRRRLVDPLVELHDAAVTSRNGNLHRRCQMHRAPEELEQLAVAINQILDERPVRPPR